MAPVAPAVLPTKFNRMLESLHSQSFFFYGYDVADWCVDPKDESGRNFQQKVLGAICAPSGKCGTGRVKAAAKLCPTVVNISKESPYTGIKMEKASSVIFSSNQNNVYCNFTRQPWLLDRCSFIVCSCLCLLLSVIERIIAVLGSSGGCNNVNAHAESGVGAELGMIAGHCFGNAAVLTYRMKECLKEVQSFGTLLPPSTLTSHSIGFVPDDTIRSVHL